MFTFFVPILMITNKICEILFQKAFIQWKYFGTNDTSQKKKSDGNQLKTSLVESTFSKQRDHSVDCDASFINHSPWITHQDAFIFEHNNNRLS